MCDWLRSSFYSYLPLLKSKICILSVITVATGENVPLLSLSRLLSVCLSYHWDPQLALDINPHLDVLHVSRPVFPSLGVAPSAQSFPSLTRTFEAGQRASHCTIHKLLHKSCKAHHHTMYVLLTHERNKNNTISNLIHLSC